MKTQKKSQIIFFIFTVMLLAVSGILLFVLPQHTYSENENRYLTTINPPTLSGFLDTSMQKNLTDGANDQFAGRDLWMKFSTALQKIVGFQDIGGVYFGKDGYYFERVLDSNLSVRRYQNNLQFLEQFASMYESNTAFLPVPTKGTVLKEYLPKNAAFYHADRFWELAESLSDQKENQIKKQPRNQINKQIRTVDIRTLLLQNRNNNQLYFKTDHHWTMYAAYLAYTAWCGIQKETAIPLTQFLPECVSSTFFGTLYSKAPGFHTQPDELVLPMKLHEADVTIDSKKADGIYDWDKLDTKDKYGIYFGGNFGRIDIHMKNCSKHAEQKKLLLIKDSFANSMVPFLMEHYQDIIMLDLRYYNKPVSNLMQELHPDETLVLYEISNFVQDMNFFKILK